MKTPVELAAGARSAGNYVTGVGGGSDPMGPVLEGRRLTLLELDERCADCTYPDACAHDRTCWVKERVAELDIVAHRRKERTARVGLGDGLAAGIKVTLPEEPHESARKLLETLGAEYEVLDGPPAPRHPETVEPEPEPEVELARGEAVAAASPSASARAGAGPGPKWTRETAIAAVRAFAGEHGRPPGVKDTKRNRALPSLPTAARLCGSWAELIEVAGYERPTRGTRYKDSSGKGAESQAATAAREEEGPRSPTPRNGGPDAQEPGLAAPSPAPPRAEVAQLDPERRPTLAGDAGSKPALRSALLGVLDALRVLVDALLPETERAE